jgi:hypothetical protein
MYCAKRSVGRETVMKRSLMLVLASSLVMMLGGFEASAQPERYSSKGYSAFWSSRHRIDGDTYLRTTWYAGVYTSEEQGEEGEVDFWSDLYKSTERCERREGRDRCHGTGGYLYGDINDLGNGEFTLDSTLNTGFFEATYPMERRRGEEQHIGKVRITVELAAVGEVTTSTETYTSSSACSRVRYSGRWEYVRAKARGAVVFLRDDRTIRLGATRDASMSQGESMSIEHTCDEE